MNCTRRNEQNEVLVIYASQPRYRQLLELHKIFRLIFVYIRPPGDTEFVIIFFNNLF